MLAEYESNSLNNLVRRGVEFSANFCTHAFYGDEKERWAMELMQKSGSYLYITAAPFIDDPTAFKCARKDFPRACGAPYRYIDAKHR